MSLLQFSLSPAASIRASPSLSCSATQVITSSSSSSSSISRSSSRSSSSLVSNSKKKRSSCSEVFTVRSSLDTVGPTVGKVTAVNKDTFWPIVKAAGDKTVVLDMYTQWCGPCKVIAPRFQELSEKYLDVVFLKLDCNQENKADVECPFLLALQLHISSYQPLAKELGIKVVPTFKILKDNKIVKEVTGAKFDDLLLAIDTVRSS